MFPVFDELRLRVVCEVEQLQLIAWPSGKEVVLFLHLNSVSYSYPGSRTPVFEALTLTFAAGWTGVVGDNGCGKSTLAGVASGRLLPSAGSVSGCVSSVTCPQDCAEEPEMLYDFACDYGDEARRLREALNIGDDMPWRFSELSCGEQKKIQVAVALWRAPDVLVLDEPTNHVDADCKEQMVDVLRGFGGVGLLVSHDRDVLDELATRCVMHESGIWSMRPGGYTQARGEADRERSEVERRKAEAVKTVRRLEAEARERAEKASRTASRRSKRGLGVRDSDARARIDLAIFTGQDGKAGRLARRMAARADAARAGVAELRVEKRYDGFVSFGDVRRVHGVMVQLPAGSIACGDALLAFGDLRVDAGEKVGVVGKNGAGKSTLVRHVMNVVKARFDENDVLYVPQELTRCHELELRKWLCGLSDAECGRAASMLVQLNARAESMLDPAGLSAGEARKLMIVRGVMESRSFMVMDEPTNHLDLHSVEALENALSSYGGALLLVSHDARFLKACVGKLWVVEAGRVREEFVG